MAGNVICPICERAEMVNKVSAIYIHALQAKKSASEKNGRALVPDLAALRGIPDEELPALGKRLAPPASPRELPTRPVHPDLVVLVFSLVLPIFLAGIRSNQPVMFVPVVAILVLCYLFYFWKRGAAIAKFERQRAIRQASGERVKRGVERWMRLYYCAEDDAVFEAGSQASAPADLIAGYLLRE